MTTQGDPAIVQTRRPEPAGEPTAPTPEPPSTALAAPESTDSGTVAVDQLVASLTELRDAIVTLRYPLSLPEAEQATLAAAAIGDQLDDYLLPRLGRLDAPLLVVVGGSTGAGKSTLVNSLVQAPVSPAGILRPTTRAPVLVCHPQDVPWFNEARLLPGLTRATNHPTGTDALQVISAPGLTPGLAFLDAPDIDSIADANPALAGQLLAAADLWLFVTTAARYADAVPWELLRSASSRGTAVALVLDRVPPGAADAIGPHLTGMLRANDLGAAPLFVLPETRLEAQGLLADRIVAPLRDWFAGLAKSVEARAAVVRQTVDGALAALVPAVEQLAEAVDAQVNVADSLAAGAVAAYGDAEAAVEQGVRDGTLLRGEVLTRWHELVDSGELMRGLQARIGRLGHRLAAAVTGEPEPDARLRSALGSGLVTLVKNAAADAVERVVAAWRVHPAGTALLATAPASGLVASSADLPERTEQAVRAWQRGVLELVRTDAGDGAFAIEATGLLVLVSVFGETSSTTVGGGTAAARKALDAVFADQAIQDLADKARHDLATRIHELLAGEAARFVSVLDGAGIDAAAADRLRRAAADLEAARAATPLAGGTGLPQPTVNGVQP